VRFLGATIAKNLSLLYRAIWSQGARTMLMRFVGALLLFFLLLLDAHAETRLALLIGNQIYSEKVGPLKNPHNDISLVGAALEKVGFKVTRIKDAGYKAIDTALKRHIQEVRRAGQDTISLVYYSGHGAADPDTQINYLIPVDVASADDADVWTNSIDLREIVNRLREQSPEAVHYVVFDACREELHLTRGGTKALDRKGFVPVPNISGVMIAYATAPGKTASDAGNGGGIYAKTLAEEIVRPGVESVMMFRTVQLKVKEAIGQDPWLSFPTLRAVYFAGTDRDPARMPALPNIDMPKGPFDGAWTIQRRGPGCPTPNITLSISIKNSVVRGNFGGGNLKGWVSTEGVIEFKHPISQFPSLSLDYSGVLRGDSGNGHFRGEGRARKCSGTFAARRG